MNKNEEVWYANYEALNAHVIEIDYSPNKHDRRLNWYKYNAKLISDSNSTSKTDFPGNRLFIIIKVCEFHRFL
jgi:hypothetical protein